MLCPKCGSGKYVKTLETRLITKTNQRKRRRVCRDCDETFTTIEMLANFNVPRTKKAKPAEPKLKETILRLLKLGYKPLAIAYFLQVSESHVRKVTKQRHDSAASRTQ